MVKGFTPHKYTVEIYKSTEKSTKIKVEGFIPNAVRTNSKILKYQCYVEKQKATIN